MITSKPTHKRFANAKDFLLFNEEGKSIGIFKINEKDSDKEFDTLMEFVDMTGAVRAVMIWTARGGNCYKEVSI